MPGLVRASTSSTMTNQKGVEGRDKPGHDYRALPINRDLFAARARDADHDGVLAFMIGEDQVAMIGFACEHFGAASAAGACFTRTRHLEPVLAQNLENRLRSRDIEHRARAGKLDLERLVVGL